MTLTVVSYNGNSTINDGTHFKTRIASGPLNVTGQAKFIPVGNGQYQKLAGKSMPGGTIKLNISIPQSSPTTSFDTLKALFDPQDLTPRTLICTDGTRQWYVEGFPVDPPATAGPAMVVTLALASPVWKTVSSTAFGTWTVTASGQTNVFNVSVGIHEVYPVYTLTPTATKLGGLLYQRFVTTYNYTRQAALAHGIDITNGGLNTANLVNFSSISLQVNNVGGYNASATTIAYDTVTGTLPAVPFNLFRDTEQMTVTARTGTTSGNLTVTRGVNGSTAESHADNAVLALSKMNYDGSDIRVRAGNSNGNVAEVPYWLSGMNGATTKIWISQDYAARAQGVLQATINNSVTTLNVTSYEGNISSSGGMILIESEICTYTAYTTKNNVGTFSGLTRGAKGTSAASHTASASMIVRVIPEIWLLYGDATLTAPTYSSARKPLFDLTSTNSSHVYGTNWNASAQNGDDEWNAAVSGSTGLAFTSDQDWSDLAPADPSTRIGVSVQNINHSAQWQLVCPFGWTQAVMTNVDRYNLPANVAFFRYGTLLTNLAKTAIAATTAADTMQTTASVTITPSSAVYFLQLYIRNSLTTNLTKRAAAQVRTSTITLSTSTTSTTVGVPFVSLGSEQSTTYDMDVVLSNDTLGESIEIKGVVPTNSAVVINTLLKTITLWDNQNGRAWMQPFPARLNWLRMQQGDNTFSFTETNMGTVTVDVSYQGRNNGPS